MLKQFFLMCSGADIKILKSCSNAEQIKFAGIGGTVFFTAVMATIAASYALFTVFNNYYAAIFFGLVWGLLIFNLDRFIVSTIKKSNSKWNEIVQVTPRIILAIIIAIVISKPLEMRIFEKEINQVLLQKKNNLTLENKQQIATLYIPEIQKKQNKIQQLKQEIKTKETETNNLYETYIAEAEGRKGTKLIGKGPVYKEKREKHDTSLAELQQLKENSQTKIGKLENQISTLQTQQNNQVSLTQPIIDNFDGLMARINALNKLPWLPSYFIFLLFLAIETAPIFSKLIASKGEYDYKFQDHENAIKLWVQQKENQRANIARTDTSLNNKIYNELENEKEIYQYKKQKALSLLQLQSDSFYKSQKEVIG